MILVIFDVNRNIMSIQLPDFIFPAIVTLENSTPVNITVLVYSQNQLTPLFVAWFNDTSQINITVYKDGDKWIEKRYELETVNAKAIGTAIENSTYYK